MADPAVADGRIVAYRGLPLADRFVRAQGRGDDAVITFGRALIAAPNTAVLRDGLPSGALGAGAPQTAGRQARHLGPAGP